MSVAIRNHVKLIAYCYIVYKDTPLSVHFHQPCSQIFAVVLQTDSVLIEEIQDVNKYSCQIYDFFLRPIFEKPACAADMGKAVLLYLNLVFKKIQLLNLLEKSLILIQGFLEQ